MTPGVLLLPARRQDRADTLGPGSSTTDDVFEARGSLFEQTPMLHRLAEHDAQHGSMARVCDRRNPWSPALDERSQMACVVFEDAAVGCGVRILASVGRRRDRNLAGS